MITTGRAASSRVARAAAPARRRRPVHRVVVVVVVVRVAVVAPRVVGVAARTVAIVRARPRVASFGGVAAWRARVATARRREVWIMVRVVRVRTQSESRSVGVRKQSESRSVGRVSYAHTVRIAVGRSRVVCAHSQNRGRSVACRVRKQFGSAVGRSRVVCANSQNRGRSVARRVRTQCGSAVGRRAQTVRIAVGPRRVV